MTSPRQVLTGVMWLGVACIPGAHAQSNLAQNPPTIQVTSRLVFLDVTVLDKHGHIVTKGLTKDDFTITEDRRPQRIPSFEQTQLHAAAGKGATGNSSGELPRTILLLDLLNSRFEDFAYIRYSVRQYLSRQPDELSSPTELAVLGNESLEVVQGYTRSKEEVMSALEHIPAVLPYKEMNASFFWERFAQSLDALQQIAVESQGVPVRKNILWVGHGAPGVNPMLVDMNGTLLEKLNQYVRDTTNMLVDARVSLFVIYPGLSSRGTAFTISAMESGMDIGDDNPFAADINFGVFVDETGGKLFYNRNDVDQEIRRSEELGSAYYTMTYQPHGGNTDGKFRRIRVTLRDPNLKAVTKAGYFAPSADTQVDPQRRMKMALSEAARSTIPMPAISLKLEDLVRHPDTGTASFSVLLAPGAANWQPAENGTSVTSLTLVAVSLDQFRDVLSSKAQSVKVLANTQDPSRLAQLSSRLPVTLRMPRKVHALRVVLQPSESDRIGAVELDRKEIDKAPAMPTPEPKLAQRPESKQTAPASAN